MASRYWVGGTGTWDASSTTNWSATSGGAGGASVPGSADTVFFNASSGGGTCTLAYSPAVISVSMTGYTGTLAFSSYNIDVVGNNVTVFAGAATYSTSGLRLIRATYSGATGTRQISGGGGTEANTISLQVTAGTDIVACSNSYNNLDFTGFAGQLSNSARTIYGDFTVSTGMTLASGANATTFASTNATPRTITTAGKTLDFPLTFNGVGGSWAFQDNTTVGSTYTVTLTNGTLNGNDKNVSLGSFALGSGTKTLTLGSGTWTVTGANWNANTNVANLTVSASTGSISMTSSSPKTFAGGAKTWPTLNQGGAGALTVQQSNTFTNITNSVQPATITLTAGTTQTVTNFTASGTSGNLITLNSSAAGTRATLLDDSGVVSVSYLSIQDIAATGSADWQAYTSNGNVDAGNNIGWEFTNPSPILAAEYPVSFRSFTERRSF